MSINKLLNYASLAFAGVLVFMSVVFAYILLVPVEVLKEWDIKMDKPSYNVGDRAVATITYTKVRNTEAKVFYYIECERPAGGFKRYNLYQINSSRAKGSGKASQDITISPEISGTPAKCRFAASANYNVYKFRNVLQETHSPLFTVYGKDE